MEFLGLIKGFYEDSRTPCSRGGRSGGTESSHQLRNKFGALYWTGRLITVFIGTYPNHVNAVLILETQFLNSILILSLIKGTHDTVRPGDDG